MMTTEYDKITHNERRKQIDGDNYARVEAFKDLDPEMVEIPCPFCGEERSEVAFTIIGYDYRRCLACRSLYNSPRLSEKSLMDFYAFLGGAWNSSVIPAEQKKERMGLIIEPRWHLLKDRLEAQGVRFPVPRVLEVGPGIGYFTELIQAHGCAREYILVEPDSTCFKYLEALEDTTLVPTMLEACDSEKHGNNDIIFINSVIEHPFSMMTFFGKLRELLRPAGFVALVDMHACGLDVEILREHTPNYTPHRILHVASVEGIRRISRRNGLTLRDVFSIGSFDADILYEHALDAPREDPRSGFRTLLDSPEVRRDIQQVLRRHLLTGYNGYLIQKDPPVA
jgi:2-polyprenyl-3-methyl-5-hydroxy-6-metoxy-1,4-benzoquinol methylase